MLNDNIQLGATKMFDNFQEILFGNEESFRATNVNLISY